jgi:hypothetical protein
VPIAARCGATVRCLLRSEVDEYPSEVVGVLLDSVIERQSISSRWGQPYVKRWLTLPELPSAGEAMKSLWFLCREWSQPNVGASVSSGLCCARSAQYGYSKEPKSFMVSGMSGQGKWAAIGAVVVVVGLACFAWAARHHRKGTTESS